MKLAELTKSIEDPELFRWIGKIFSLTIAPFLLSAIETMVPWLIAMFSVVLCDLFFGYRGALLMKEEIRFSRAWRGTMGKMITYFSFVMMVVLIEKVSGSTYNIDKFSILFVCFIEGCSIISNILKPKGYDLNVTAAMGLLLKKAFNINKEDTADVITKKSKQDERE